jgi:hypothetical protein
MQEPLLIRQTTREVIIMAIGDPEGMTIASPLDVTLGVGE